MSDFSFNVVCTTIGRESLSRLLNSLKYQLSKDDYFTIISDINHDLVELTLTQTELNSKIKHIKNEGDQLGKYGHPLLNRHINNLQGDFIMFADDDDYYTPNAFNIIRKFVKEKKLYIFKHKWGNTVNWNSKNFEIGNVGKCMGIIPNTGDLPKFREDVLGDVYFYEEISKKFEYEFIDEIIYKVRDTI